MHLFFQESYLARKVLSKKSIRRSFHQPLLGGWAAFLPSQHVYTMRGVLLEAPCLFSTQANDRATSAVAPLELWSS